MGFKIFHFGPDFQSCINNDWKLYISVGSIVAYIKSLSGLNSWGNVIIDSLNKENKNRMDLLTRIEWISPVHDNVYLLQFSVLWPESFKMERDVLFSGGIRGIQQSLIPVNTQEQSSYSFYIAFIIYYINYGWIW